jgi:hypothetical protein
MNPAERYKGWAPDMAKSLTVPLTAGLPMSPPGKKIGVTTKESVVKANFTPCSPLMEKTASLEVLNPLDKGGERLIVLQIADVVAYEGIGPFPQREGVLELRPTR